MVAQIDEQNAAVVADAMAPAGKTDRLAFLGEAESAAIVRAVTMHGFHFFLDVLTTRRCAVRSGKSEAGKARDGKVLSGKRESW